MVCAMDEAGVLNSMTAEQLVVTCTRLERSISDMETLHKEFQHEQVWLQQKQEQLHGRIEKYERQLESGKGSKKDRGLVAALIQEVDTQLPGLSRLFIVKEERKAAKRRKFNRPSEKLLQAKPAAQEEDGGPFSDTHLKMSWGCDISLGALRQATGLKGASVGLVDLDRWVREVVCGDPVAEAEPLPENAEMWAAQLAAVKGPDASPMRISPKASNADITGMNLSFFEGGRSHLPDTPPRGTPPLSARQGAPVWKSMSRPEPAPSPKSRGYGPDGEPWDDGAYVAQEQNPLDMLVSSAVAMVESTTGRVIDAPAPSSLSRRINEMGGLGGLANWAVNQAVNLTSGDGFGVAEMSTSRSVESSAVMSLTVVLRRAGDGEKWGLHWHEEPFSKNKERIVKTLLDGSVADLHNRMQRDAGYPERSIQPSDWLRSVNGRMGPDEIKAELTGREVVLEFQRIVARRDVSSPPRAELVHSQEPLRERGVRKGPAGQRGKATFQSAFSAYMQTVAPTIPESPEGKKAAEADAASGAPEAAAAASAADGADRPEADKPSTSPAEATELPDPAAPPADDAAETAAAPLSEKPHGVVVQVLSLGAGSVRLSWLFDWAAAPEGQDAARGFEVVRRAEGDEEVRHPCSGAPLVLELPVGRRYMFEVVATLSDSWRSPASESVSADLRIQEKTAVSAVSGGAAPGTGVGSWAPPVRRPGVAGRLGAFMAQKQEPSDPSSSSTSKAPTSPEKVSSPNKAPIVMGGSDPLTASRPGMVASGRLGPAAEKRDLEERLRSRYGGRDVVKYDDNAFHKRSESMDSDDENSLQKLSNALGSLAAATATKGNIADSVAQEGPHSLQMRLDPGLGPQDPMRPGGVKASAAVGADQSPVRSPPPMAKPAQDSADSAGWSNFEDGDGAADAKASRPPAELAESTSPAATVADLRLQVVLGDGKHATLRFREGDDLPKCISDFVATNHMKDLFAQPLLERVELMARTGRAEDSVDIIDLV